MVLETDYPSIDVAVIGLGVSSLPILRRLDQLQEKNETTGPGLSFLCFTEREFGIWGILNEANDDFDILTSHCVSGFSWFPRTWNDGVEETEFPFVTAKAYYKQLQDSITPSLRRRIVHCNVSVVKEEKDGSGYILYDDLGCAICHCRKVVETESRSLGYTSDEYVGLLKKALLLKSKTVVLEGYSDTTNMLMARLMLGGNRVLFTSKHFKNFDKCLPVPKRANKDRLGWIGYEIVESGIMYSFFPEVFAASTSWFNTCVSPYSRHPFTSYLRRKTGLDDYVIVEDFMTDKGDVRPTTLQGKSGPPAGWGLTVKYWNVDAFFDHFGMYRDLMLRNRMLLNDPYFFMKLGRVSVIHPSRVQWESKYSVRVGNCPEPIHVDWRVRSSKQVKSNKGAVTFIDKDGREYPNICYEDYLYGIWHPDHPNLYHVGKTRPITGGYAHTGEAVGEFIVKLLIDPSFQDSIQENFDILVENMKQKHYDRPDSDPGLRNAFLSSTSAHELQGLMGRHPSFTDALLAGSFSALDKYLFGPTLALRYQTQDVSLTSKQRSAAADRYQDICENHSDIKDGSIFFAALLFWPYLFLFNAVMLFASIFVLHDNQRTLIILFVGILTIATLATTGLAKWIRLSLSPYTDVATYCDASFLIPTVHILPILIMYNVACCMSWWPTSPLKEEQAAAEEEAEEEDEGAHHIGGLLVITTGFLVRSGLLPLFAAYLFAAYSQIVQQQGRIPFNDIRGKEKFSSSFNDYVAAMQCTEWYQKATSSSLPSTPPPSVLLGSTSSALCVGPSPKRWEDVTFSIRTKN